MFSALLFAIEKLACSNLAQKVLCSIRARYFFQVAILKPVFSSADFASLVEVQKANRKLSASSMKLRFRKGTRLFNSSYQKTFWGWPDTAQAGTYSLQASQHSLKKMKVY